MTRHAWPRRYWPIVHIVRGQSVKDIVVEDMLVPADATCIALLHATMHDPALYQDSEKCAPPDPHTHPAGGKTLSGGRATSWVIKCLTALSKLLVLHQPHPHVAPWRLQNVYACITSAQSVLEAYFNLTVSLFVFSFSALCTAFHGQTYAHSTGCYLWRRCWRRQRQAEPVGHARRFEPERFLAPRNEGKDASGKDSVWTGFWVRSALQTGVLGTPRFAACSHQLAGLKGGGGACSWCLGLGSPTSSTRARGSTPPSQCSWRC